MPLQTYSSDEDGLATISAEGDVSWDDLRVELESLLLAATFNPTLPHLIDLRDATLRLDNAESVEAFGRFFSTSFGTQVNGSIAMVIHDGLSTAECASLYRVLCDLANAELFDDYDLAMRWVMKREFVATPTTGFAANATLH